MLQDQLTKGNNGLLKRKYITFGVEADSIRTAKVKLDRIETDILNNFKTLGVETEPLSGYERLKVLHDVFNMVCFLRFMVTAGETDAGSAPMPAMPSCAT